MRSQPRMTPEGVRRYYDRIGIPMPADVQAVIAGKKRNQKIHLPPAPVRYYDQDPEEKVIELPFTPLSRNYVDTYGFFARARSKKAFVVLVRRHLLAQQVRAFRSKVEIEQEIHFSVHRERDEDNYSPKWLGDALKGWVFADDAARFVTWKAPVFVVDGTEATVLRIRPAGVG